MLSLQAVPDVPARPPSVAPNPVSPLPAPTAQDHPLHARQPGASSDHKNPHRGQADGSYCPTAGRRVYDARRSRCRRRRRLVEGGALHRFVHDHLVHRRWSPEQIAQRLRIMKPDDPSARVSHETIYAAIYAQPRGGLKAAMVDALRQAKPARGRRRTTLAGNAIVPESLRIVHRPEEIGSRPSSWCKFPDGLRA